MLLRATQLNGGAEEPLQWGNTYITKQFMAFALKKVQRSSKCKSSKAREKS